VFAVDSNILVYAHRADSAWHAAALACIRDLAEGAAAWAIPWPCIHEFLAICTHPRIYNPPTPIAHALEALACWLESPTLVLLSEGPGYAERLKEVLEESKVVGAAIHDARIAALCRLHGVKEILSADRDFSRFRGLEVTNPLHG
jgi:toxin-antitoxin system PIN domain toxin